MGAPKILVLLIGVVLISAMTSQQAALAGDSSRLSLLEPRGETPITLIGWFTVIWGDGMPGSRHNPEPWYRLITDDGQAVELSIDEELIRSAGGVLSLDRQRVHVAGGWKTDMTGQVRRPMLQVVFISLAASSGSMTARAALTGSQSWVSILCKFADIAGEPRTLGYFQNMYGAARPGLDHYWREASYNRINLVGSAAYGWFALPQPRSYYIYDYTGDGYEDIDFYPIIHDCTAAASSAVHFPSYAGINLMFNYELDGTARGGSNCLNLNGIFGCWYMTLEPPWGYSNLTVMSHEMGHGFGLPHSSGNYGAIYDNQWDVLSDTWSNCFRSTDAIYGCLGQHTISYHKDILGWIPEGQKYTVGRGIHTRIMLERLALPHTGSYLMAQIPIRESETHFYTVEVRHQTEASYDIKLPGQGVIIHEVDVTRERPAYVVDMDWNGNTGDEGAMWKVGETYTDAVNDISVRVISATSTGLQVEIQNGFFVDVPLDHWAYSWIKRLHAAGITGGCATTPLQFCPEASVTRDQMPVFLLRVIHGSSYAPPPVGASTGFNDIPINYWSAAWIKQLAAEKITGGCGAGNYCPGYPVTRAQMAVLLLKAKHGSSFIPPTVGGGTGFNDVPANYWAAAWIKQLAAEGITGGCGSGIYCPESAVTRAQMAVFLVKTFNLP